MEIFIRIHPNVAAKGLKDSLQAWKPGLGTEPDGGLQSFPMSLGLHRTQVSEVAGAWVLFQPRFSRVTFLLTAVSSVVTFYSRLLLSLPQSHPAELAGELLIIPISSDQTCLFLH